MSLVASGPRSGTRRKAADEVAANVFRLGHVLNRFKQSVHNAAKDDGDWLTNYLLFHVLANGPMRASDLADSTEVDPSTVSRQVATLVKDGLLERRADPGDGRACLLHATPEAARRHTLHLDRRNDHYAQMLADWSVEDQRTFAALLARFTSSFDEYKSTLLADISDQRNQFRKAP
jgi:DNA-binding MarR family transcriptional regulator